MNSQFPSSQSLSQPSQPSVLDVIGRTIPNLRADYRVNQFRYIRRGSHRDDSVDLAKTLRPSHPGNPLFNPCPDPDELTNGLKSFFESMKKGNQGVRLIARLKNPLSTGEPEESWTEADKKTTMSFALSLWGPFIDIVTNAMKLQEMGHMSRESLDKLTKKVSWIPNLTFSSKRHIFKAHELEDITKYWKDVRAETSFQYELAVSIQAYHQRQPGLNSFQQQFSMDQGHATATSLGYLIPDLADPALLGCLSTSHQPRLLASASKLDTALQAFRFFLLEPRWAMASGLRILGAHLSIPHQNHDHDGILATCDMTEALMDVFSTVGFCGGMSSCGTAIERLSTVLQNIDGKAKEATAVPGFSLDAVRIPTFITGVRSLAQDYLRYSVDHTAACATCFQASQECM